ncbi:MAG: Lipoprotein signal peptidase [Eubacteriales bacterium SKADARSKE-1]|nr:Lipoprotein signal peptidase [Eubacteriales bacterium SKADARSKE-1]
MLLGFVFVGLIILADQLIKMQVVNYIKTVGEITIIPGFLNISYVENRGAAFGFLQGFKYFFIIVSLIMILAFIYFIFLKKINNKLFLAASILIIGGGIGNLIDRFTLGYVIDYIKVSFFPPVCNLADYCISVGAGLLLLYFLFFSQEKENLNSETI